MAFLEDLPFGVCQEGVETGLSRGSLRRLLTRERQFGSKKGFLRVDSARITSGLCWVVRGNFRGKFPRFTSELYHIQILRQDLANVDLVNLLGPPNLDPKL